MGVTVAVARTSAVECGWCLIVEVLVWPLLVVEVDVLAQAVPGLFGIEYSCK